VLARLYRLSEVPSVTLVPRAKSRLITGKKAMASFIEMEPGMKFPIHKHRSEEIMIVLEGSIKRRVANQEFMLSKGDVLVVDSDEVHGGNVSKEGCKAIDVFIPPRKDYQELVQTST